MLSATLVVFGPSSLVQPREARAATHLGATTYSSNTTWAVTGSPYILDGDVTVAAGATLTIDPGVVVKFNGSFRSLVVNGVLSAVGTSGSPITFTSIQDDSIGGDSGGDGATVGAPGQWLAIRVGSSNSDSVLRFVTVRYGGYGSIEWNYGALEVTSTGASSLRTRPSRTTSSPRSRSAPARAALFPA